MAFSAIPALAGAITLAKLNYLTFDFKQQAWECHRKMHDQWRMFHIAFCCKHMLEDPRFGKEVRDRKELSDRYFSLHSERNSCTRELFSLQNDLSVSSLFSFCGGGRARIRKCSLLKMRHSALSREIASLFLQGQPQRITGSTLSDQKSLAKRDASPPTKIPFLAECAASWLLAHPKEYCKDSFRELISSLDCEQLDRLHAQVRHVCAETTEKVALLAIAKRETFMRGVALLQNGFVCAFDLGFVCYLASNCMGKWTAYSKMLLVASKYFGGASFFAALCMSLAVRIASKRFAQEAETVQEILNVQSAMREVIGAQILQCLKEILQNLAWTRRRQDEELDQLDRRRHQQKKEFKALTKERVQLAGVIQTQVGELQEQGRTIQMQAGELNELRQIVGGLMERLIHLEAQQLPVA